MPEWQLRVRTSHLTFKANFGFPVFELLEMGSGIWKDVFQIFKDLDLKLTDFKIEGDTSSLASQSLVVTVKNDISLRFRLDRLEVTSSLPADTDLLQLVDITGR
ncbi:MAG TPA: hypothetical protein VGL91_11050, partial [Acidobacteriota bacterium]